MSTIGWSTGWESLKGFESRRHRGLSKMMALSFFLHLFFFIFVLVGRPLLGIRPPAFQSYQVNLVSPSPLTSTAAQGPAAGAPLQSAEKATTERSPAPSAPPAPARVARPSVSAKAPKMEMKQDPERLQEWWKKAAIKVPPVQPKPTPSVQEPAKVEITRRTRIQPPPSTNPSVSSTPGISSTPGASNKEKAGQGSGSHDQTASVQPGGAGPGGAGSQSGVVSAGGSANGPLAQFPGYLQNSENKISGNWAPPPVSMQGEQVGTIVKFNIRKDGRIELVSVEKSSGNSFFDEAAMRAIYAADPLPPLPDGLSEDRLTVHFSFMVSKGS